MIPSPMKPTFSATLLLSRISGQIPSCSCCVTPQAAIRSFHQSLRSSGCTPGRRSLRIRASPVRQARTDSGSHLCQAPEPGTGEIHYPFVLGELEKLGYEGYVGLECNPTTATTDESFGWLPEELRNRNMTVSDL